MGHLVLLAFPEHHSQDPVDGTWATPFVILEVPFKESAWIGGALFRGRPRTPMSRKCPSPMSRDSSGGTASGQGWTWDRPQAR